MPIAIFFSWQDQYTSAEWRATELLKANAVLSEKDHEIGALQTALAQKDRPLVITTDPEITKMLNRQERELAQLKDSLPSPKKRALQLSNDIFKFYDNRMKNQPHFPEQTPVSEQERNQQLAQFSQASEQWMHETGTAYNREFSSRVAILLEQMREAGLKEPGIEMCTESMGNTYSVQHCAARIGALADKFAN